ncbi:MAG: O-acetyl-ADP-ribose deacetylase (regulator of RNase III) [Myxococcota bacterium]
MYRLLPTEALTPSRTLPIGASDSPISRFAQTLNGYDACGGREGLLAAVKAMPGLHACTLHQLRLTLFLTQRQYDLQGGSCGPEDPVVETMREVCDIIRTRVLNQQSALLSWTGDITKLDVDAIVNATNPTLLGGSDVDGVIHRAAGPKLAEACSDLPLVSAGVRCPTGEARLTPGFDLPAAHIIHTVCPQWSGGDHGEDALLASAYEASLTLALERRFQSIAFPAIPTGAYGFPQRRAERIATNTIHRLLSTSSRILRVLFVHYPAPTSESAEA